MQICPENLAKYKKIIHPVEIMTDMTFCYPSSFVIFLDLIHYSFSTY